MLKIESSQWIQSECVFLLRRVNSILHQSSSNDVSNTKIEEIKIRFKITPPTRVQDLEHSSCKRIDWP